MIKIVVLGETENHTSQVVGIVAFQTRKRESLLRLSLMKDTTAAGTEQGHDEQSPERLSGTSCYHLLDYASHKNAVHTICLFV